ncbi:MAG: hypothetical protein K8Q99_04380 [Acholeplasmataceae bacterium]|nr:hypothetical protein [Acholeplasmataceae bacterium]
MMNFLRVKKVITTEAEIFNISDFRIYSLVLECLDYNKSLADEFMLSDLGGYDEKELERIHRIRNNTNKRVQNQACAF